MAYPIPVDQLLEAGRGALDATLRMAGDVDEGIHLEPRLELGGVVTHLTAAARHARALVVGSDRRSASMRLLTGNVSTGVAARATVPVVSVPETWASGSSGTVLVGVKHPQHSESLMAEAFALADLRGSRLVALHAWRLPSATTA